jgi:Domain of unknown function (DUF5069)
MQPGPRHPAREGGTMNAPDLRLEPPRRWNVEIDGVRWLARLADKARAANDGTLGTYLYGHSPMDRSLLAVLRLSHDEFARLAVQNDDDNQLVASLQAYDPGLQRARAWSDVLPKRYWWFLAVLDIDDGYRASPFHGAVSAGADAISGLVKRIMPSDYRGKPNT